ncbi:hypothetical protein G5V58_22785 [Nocardioides anomalus]|uniref:Uncharacterized protein n=1 Tax=Nocardioides anomalus TaxID=2712223 RepID=A0A6G6WJ97_9ACTN|nr:hypothetical protein [Nocardioides anomalus]QIG45213.1 hypothetical protein G5V58_22785 [Nocardioides anomalus]
MTVDLPLYEEPGHPDIHESSDRDNTAQSNYDRFWSETASPAARKRFRIKLENPTDATAVIYARVRQTLPYYRTYLDHRWLRIPARQTREIQVMTESLDGDPAHATFIDRHREQLWGETNLLEISGHVQGVCSTFCTGGASVETRTARKAVIEDVRFYPEPGAAGVVRQPDGTPATGGEVLMVFRHEDEPLTEERTATAQVNSSGGFFVYDRRLERGMVAGLHYLGGWGYAPCDLDGLRAEWD